MFKYILKRIGISILVLFGVSVVIYMIVRLMPTDFIENKYQSQLANGQMTMEDIYNMKEPLGLNDNSFWGILKGYWKWFSQAIQGNLGDSWKYNRKVSDVIGENMWISFSIAIIATALQFLIAIPLGITSATHQYRATTFAGWWAKLFDTIHHLILPIFCSVILSIGGLMRYTRTNMLEVLSSDYIRTARAKGLSEKKVIYKHAFRNTMIPIVTLLAGILPSLFGGMMITEEVFGIPGIGRMAYKALTEGDIPFIMGYNMFLAILTVLGTLFSDIMYSVVDPRVKLGK